MKTMARLRPWLAGLTLLYCIAVLLGAVLDTVYWQDNQAKQKKAHQAAQSGSTLLPIGSPVATFTLKSNTGKSYDLEKILQTKRLVLVEFFATWCPHCQRTAPILRKITAETPDVQVLAINAGDTNAPSTSAAFVKTYHLNYPVLENPDMMLLKLYGLYGYPTLYVIDKNMIVQWSHSGELLPDDIVKLYHVIHA